MDIVKRLRGEEPCKDLVKLRNEAADKIEALTTELDRSAFRKLAEIYNQSLGVGGFIQETERVFGTRLDRLRLADVWLAFEVAAEGIDVEGWSNQ